jgi:hypothetical protein
MITNKNEIAKVLDVEGKDYLNSIKVTYTTSEAFKERKADVGDFFYREESMGNNIKVVPVAYAFQLICFTEEGEFVDKLVLKDTGVAIKEREEYKEFHAKNGKGATRIKDGVLILLYLSDRKEFCEFFCSGGLLRGSIKLLDLADEEKEFNLFTVLVEKGKRTYVNLSCTETGKTFKLEDIEKAKMLLTDKEIVNDDEEKSNRVR